MKALESLKVTTEIYAAMLYPLVESALPEELLRIWQGHSTSAGNIDTRDRLSRLMSFLQIEVVAEEKIAMAVDGFNINVTAKELKEKRRKKRKRDHRQEKYHR